MKNLKKTRNKNENPPKRSGISTKKRVKRMILAWLVIIGYLFYLFLILMARLPFIAEQYTESSMPETVESHLTFPIDGRQTHYDVQRVNQSIPGKIDVIYYSKTNTLRTTLKNIGSLTIYARSMYYDECKEVYGFDPVENSNYYKWFFIEKNHLNVNINSDSSLELLQFVDVPMPNQVIVDQVQWTESKEYEYNPSKGIALSNVSTGITEVDIYFKPTNDIIKGPVAKITAEKKIIFIDEVLEFDGSSSYDPSFEGKIINYHWDFGDGNFSTGKDIVKHTYTEPGVFGVILTVVNQDYYVDQAYYNLSVLESSEHGIHGRVPNLNIVEDSPTQTLNLRNYEPYSLDPEGEYFWYIIGNDNELYSISGENSSNDQILITPNLNQFGNNLVWLWMEDQNGTKDFQQLWINITPVNDPPTIFGIPDITIHYDVPYEFNYLPYIKDVDTSISKLVLNTSEATHTKISKLNVTYTYPKSMVDETVYVILSIWDGKSESSDVVAVWITDDWVPNLLTPLPNVYLDEGQVYKNYFDLDDYFMDPDNDTLYYSYGYTHVNVVINLDHSVDFYAPNDWNGEELTTFRATDPSGALVEDIITVIVRPINDPPVIKDVPNIIVRYDQDYVFDVSAYIYDEDNTLDELILTSSDPEHIKNDIKDHLVLIFNYPYQTNIPYTQTITLTVTDGIDSSFQMITVYVKDNYPPVLNQPFSELILYEDVPKNSAINLYDYFMDNDSSMLYFRAINNNKINVKFHVNGTIDFGCEQNWSGQETITFRAEDPEYAFVEGKMEVSVLPVNDPPVIAEIPIQRFNTSEKYKLDILPYISDIDNNITKLNIWLESSELDCEIFGTNIIFYTTKSVTVTITLHVSDGQAESTQKILVKVVGKEVSKQDLFVEFSTLMVIILILIMGIFGFVYRGYRGNFDITELFLIYQNGLLILHLSNEEINRDETDADIISAMFTAVQDFTRDSFANGTEENENWSLKKLEFKKNNILIDRGKNIYIAAIFTGRPGKKLGNQLKKIRSEIETQFASELNDWSGEMDQLDGICNIIEGYKIISRPNLSSKTAPAIDTSPPNVTYQPQPQPQTAPQPIPQPAPQPMIAVGTYNQLHSTRKQDQN